jgi:hypothetical protein
MYPIKETHFLCFLFIYFSFFCFKIKKDFYFRIKIGNLRGFLKQKHVKTKIIVFYLKV